MEKVKKVDFLDEIKKIDLEELCEMEEVVTPAPFGNSFCCFKN